MSPPASPSVRRVLPPLQDLAVRAIARSPHVLEPPGVLAAIGEELTMLVLAEVIKRGALTPQLLRAMRASPHSQIHHALGDVDESLGYIGPPPRPPKAK